MDIHEIEASLENSDFQYRLKAIAALKDYTPEIAVPLLKSKLNDPEFLVRSFVSRGFGQQQTAESFAALLQIIKLDNTGFLRKYRLECKNIGEKPGFLNTMVLKLD